MDPLFLLGFVLLGALLIGLGLGHKSWQVHRSGQRYTSAPVTNQARRSRSIPKPRQANPIQESKLSAQQSQPQSSQRQRAATRVNRVSPPHPAKAAAAQMAVNHRQQVNPAVRKKQTQINHAQRINPLSPPSQMRPLQRSKLPNRPSELRPPHPGYLASSQAQGRQAQSTPSRRVKSTNTPPELISPQSKYSAHNQAQGRPTQRHQAQIRKGQIQQTPIRPSRQAKATAKPIDGALGLTPPQPRYPYPPVNPSQQRPTQRRQTQQQQAQREQDPIRQARMRQAQRKATRRASPVDASSESLQYAADFKLTQMRPLRQVNAMNNQSAPIPPIKINSAFKASQLGNSLRAKLPSDWPGSFPTE